MILSDAFPMQFRGKPAQLRVVRNDGHCWGEIRCGRDRYSVSTKRDQYERSDDDAAEAFKRAALNARNLAQSLLVS